MSSGLYSRDGHTFSQPGKPNLRGSKSARSQVHMEMIMVRPIMSTIRTPIPPILTYLSRSKPCLWDTTILQESHTMKTLWTRRICMPPYLSDLGFASLHPVFKKMIWLAPSLYNPITLIRWTGDRLLILMNRSIRSNLLLHHLSPCMALMYLIN